MSQYLDLAKQALTKAHFAGLSARALSPHHPISRQISNSFTARLTEGVQVWWYRPSLNKTLGPAVVEFIHTTEDGKLWIFVTLEGRWAALSETLLTRIESASNHGARYGD